LHLAEYIYRNCTFVEHIALMGLENIGYAPRNMKELWIDPYDYQEELEATVEFLSSRGLNASGVSSKAANWGQIKTGQRKWPGTVRSFTRS